MIIYPAIDLYEGKAVRLYKGDYERMTVYSDDPPAIAEDFASQGAERIHLVDLEGARSGGTPNLEVILRIKERTGLFCEVGGGIRSMETAERYLSSGVDRVILGTAAVQQPEFLASAAEKYGSKIAVGVDIRDGCVAVKGWTENSGLEAFDFCRRLQSMGIRTVICTDISRDGAMKGTNRELYRALSRELSMDIIASGGVSNLEDVRALRELGIHGAIIGKAYYTGAISVKEAVEAAL
ncbi:MAG: 1-(5-phosphoribosyl)-5-[(5-phosphoribosylamino)methylideneamino]imidazole-4-carboxamide isomerase [Oscillospiraceae bacterium]|nr:1-(5-phosphoribosyl)-5-[(5-phosphoribosylamino)methylideneamino]imidazole-4-carboxamide isomerase [Oscillospiraceae bacterium]